MIWSLLFIITILFIIWLNNTYHFISLTPKLPVLMYHSISKSHKASLTVLQKELEKQFEYLQKNNYQTIFIEEVNNPIQKKVMLTFDDAYLNNLELLMPLLEKYHFKATIFIPFQHIGQYDTWVNSENKLMTIEELKSLNPKYIQLGWHSFAHQSYKDLSIKDIRTDLEKCHEFITENSLIVSPSMAYPYGAYPKEKEKQYGMFELFKDFGIKYAFRIGNKLNLLPIKNNYLIKRIDIRGTDSLWIFKWKLKFGRIKPF